MQDVLLLKFILFFLFLINPLHDIIFIIYIALYGSETHPIPRKI